MTLSRHATAQHHVPSIIMLSFSSYHLTHPSQFKAKSVSRTNVQILPISPGEENKVWMESVALISKSQCRGQRGGYSPSPGPGLWGPAKLDQVTSNYRPMSLAFEGFGALRYRGRSLPWSHPPPRCECQRASAISSPPIHLLRDPLVSVAGRGPPSLQPTVTGR